MKKLFALAAVFAFMAVGIAKAQETTTTTTKTTEPTTTTEVKAPALEKKAEVKPVKKHGVKKTTKKTVKTEEKTTTEPAPAAPAQ